MRPLASNGDQQQESGVDVLKSDQSIIGNFGLKGMESKTGLLNIWPCRASAQGYTCLSNQNHISIITEVFMIHISE